MPEFWELSVCLCGGNWEFQWFCLSTSEGTVGQSALLFLDFPDFSEAVEREPRRDTILRLLCSLEHIFILFGFLLPSSSPAFHAAGSWAFCASCCANGIGALCFYLLVGFGFWDLSHWLCFLSFVQTSPLFVLMSVLEAILVFFLFSPSYDFSLTCVFVF